MGREIRRVALDFDWPLNQTWEGFLNPYSGADKCPACDETGYSPEAKRLSDQWYGNEPFNPAETGSQPFTIETPEVRAFAERNVEGGRGFYGMGVMAVIREAQRLLSHWNTQWCHHLDQDDVDALWKEARLYDFNPNWRENKNVGVPAPFAQDVNRWSLGGMGHDSINHMICVEAKCKRLGYELHCPQCQGNGEIWRNQATKYLYEAWTEIAPPAGEGWQVWETVSEGSPISPVFATAEELQTWLVGEGYSAEAAEKFTKSGWAPSMVTVGGELYRDIESLSALPPAPSDAARGAEREDTP